jgi:hypothetical protein
MFLIITLLALTKSLFDLAVIYLLQFALFQAKIEGFDVRRLTLFAFHPWEAFSKKKN